MFDDREDKEPWPIFQCQNVTKHRIQDLTIFEFCSLCVSIASIVKHRFHVCRSANKSRLSSLHPQPSQFSLRGILHSSQIYGVHFNKEKPFSSWMLGKYILNNLENFDKCLSTDLFFYFLLTDTETISSLLNFVNNTNFEFTGH